MSTATRRRTYSQRGLHVFPIFPPDDVGGCACGNPTCEHPAKHPIGNLVPNGLLNASTDATTIRQWHALYPDMNVAIRTGAVSGIVVLDVDPRHGGDATLAALEADHGSLPDTPTVITGGNGWHCYFAHPSGTVTSRPDAIGRGLDMKADGGYVLAPPSRHVSGREYFWAAGLGLDDLDPPPLPPWLLARLATRQSRTMTPAAGIKISNGQRNVQLTSMGGSMRRRGFYPEAILAALQVQNRLACAEPLADQEVERIADSISRYEPDVTAPAIIIRRNGTEVTL